MKILRNEKTIIIPNSYLHSKSNIEFKSISFPFSLSNIDLCTNIQGQKKQLEN